jgi:hypothetical protein
MILSKYIDLLDRINLRSEAVKLLQESLLDKDITDEEYSKIENYYYESWEG